MPFLFQLLTLSEGDEMSWKWAYPGDIPPNAVRCADTQIEDECYLGVSLYSDGICLELGGKIDTNGRMIHMTMNREPHRCPFFMYLTIKEAPITVLKQFLDKVKYEIQ